MQVPRLRLPRPGLPRRAAAGLLAAALVAGGGFMWLRDSSLVRVRDVYVVGLSSSESGTIRAALTAAARDMTTLHVREEQLRLAVRPYPSVAGIAVRTDFPRAMTIEVTERRPLAAVDLGGARVPVGAGGLLLRGVRIDGKLPAVRASRPPAGNRLTDPRALSAVNVLAAAPEPLRPRVDRAWFGPRGLVLDMRMGPDLIFGSQQEAPRKWAAAARVLADPSAVGATYLDVRVPERVGAGGLEPVGTQPQLPSSNPQPEPENTVSLDP